MDILGEELGEKNRTERHKITVLHKENENTQTSPSVRPPLPASKETNVQFKRRNHRFMSVNIL